MIGHFIHEALYNRGALSVFRAMYAFVKDSYVERTRLWWSCRQECMVVVGILPLIISNIARPWSPRMVTTDASPTGWGICSSLLDPELVATHGRWNERWRFRRLSPDEWAPRKRALALHEAVDPFHDLNTVPLGVFRGNPLCAVPPELRWREREGFPEIGPTDDWGWKVDRLGVFKYDEHITAKEARVAVWSVAFDMEKVENHHCRMLRLVDNFAVSLSMSKGRAHSHGMLQQTRRLAALNLACDVMCVFRWIPSELNPADEPSRRLEGIFKGRSRPAKYVEASLGSKTSRSKQWVESWQELEAHLGEEGVFEPVFPEYTHERRGGSTAPEEGASHRAHRKDQARTVEPLSSRRSRDPHGGRRAGRG